MSACDTTIFVFAKPPSAEGSKTRLAADIGAAAARALAEAFLRDVWQVARAVPHARAVLATTSDPRDYGLGDHVPSVPQGDGDLGTRMAHMISVGLADTRSAVVLGTDCPGIAPHHIREAVDALRTHDACLAPTRDGGFYLLALRRVEHGLFDGLPWSTPEARDATRARLHTRGYTTALGPSWFDVDDGSALDHVAAAWPSVAAHAPETAGALLRLGLVERTPEGHVRRATK